MRRIAVGFDFDHTLGIDNKLERTVGMELLARAARECGDALDESTALQIMEAALLRYRSSHALERFPKDTSEPRLNGPDVREIEGALREEWARGGYHGPVYEMMIARFRAEAFARAGAFVQPIAGSRELLEHLTRAGIPCALLSNGWSPLQQEKARLIGFPGEVFVSEVIGARKPSPEAFAVLVRHFALAPSEILYVGDDPMADVEGARRAGMVSVWFDGEDQPYPPALEPPAYRIKRPAELVAVATEVQGRSASAPKP